MQAEHLPGAKQVRQLLAESGRLNRISDTATLDCQLLLTRVLGVSRAWLYAHDDALVQPAEVSQFEHLLGRRLQGEPIAYLTGTQDFWDMSLEVSPATLIPRPDTETLVNAVLGDFDLAPRCCVDLGTGTGAIALALARSRPAWQVFALERDPDALAVAARNLARYAAGGVTLVRGDWTAALATNSVDIMVANPPYISADDLHLQELRFEPGAALVSAENGQRDIRLIATDALRCLKPGGALYLEHGWDQQEPVAALLTRLGYLDLAVYPDLGGHPRVTRGYKPDE